MKPPPLGAARDVEFDATGDVNLRFTYKSLGCQTEDGHHLSRLTRVVVIGDEVRVYSGGHAYEWNAETGKWRRCAE